MFLRPLRTPRERAWITDCLDTYFTSTGAAARLFEPAIVDALARLGIPSPEDGPHPSENDIVGEGLAGQRKRLVAEVSAANRRVMVTLGNAALRVMAALARGGPFPQKLSPAQGAYARSGTVGVRRSLRFGNISRRDQEIWNRTTWAGR